MRTLAQQQSQPQQQASPNITKSNPVAAAASHQTHLILNSQRTVESQAVQRRLQSKPARLEVGSGARAAARSGSDFSRKPVRPTSKDLKQRQRAKALKAADARTLLHASLPFVLAHMTDEQVQKMQRVLDAAVVNPDVRKEAEGLYRRSIVAQSGSLIIRDPKMVRRAFRAMESFIPVTEADTRIRLDFKALLTSEALQATTDNPDEARYLEMVRQTLATRGIWLRFSPKLVPDPEEPSHRVVDQQTFTVWLSLGPDGDTIPIESGRLTRNALLSTTRLGAGYYRHVHQGGIQSALEKETRRLLDQIEIGLRHHNRLDKIRDEAFFGVAKISDFLGGADFPDRSIWEPPHKLVVQAMRLNAGGNVKGAQALLGTAAILTRNAGWLLADYLEESSAGAERAVAVLEVAKTAGEIAEIGLAVTEVVGVVRGIAKREVLVGTSVRQFRRDAERIISRDPNHPLRFLLDGKRFKRTKGLSHDKLIDDPSLVQMGHIRSKKLGGEERIMLQGAWENQVQGITIERKAGVAVLDNPTIDIGGIAVHKATAEWWEKIGWLPRGTVLKGR